MKETSPQTSGEKHIEKQNATAKKLIRPTLQRTQRGEGEITNENTTQYNIQNKPNEIVKKQKIHTQKLTTTNKQ